MKGKFTKKDIRPFMTVATSIFHSPNARATVKVRVTRGAISRDTRLTVFTYANDKLLEDDEFVTDALARALVEKLNIATRHYKTIQLI